MPQKAKVAICEEVVLGFTERVHEAAAMDPRGLPGDPMEWHRHRIHPLAWKTLENAGTNKIDAAVAREVEVFARNRDHILARRPIYAQLGDKPPWPNR
jgi:hypothetical protein